MHATVLVSGAGLQELAVGGVKVLLPQEVILLQAAQLLLDARGHICVSRDSQSIGLYSLTLFK